MRNLALGMVAFAALCGTVLAQDLTGTWQGTLQRPQELRAVIKIVRNGDALQGTLHSIDQGGQGRPINPVTLQGGTVKMAIPGIGATYEGKLEADGNSISGTFTVEDSQPLNLKRATPETAWAIPEPPPPPKPMAADTDPSFEVATIKPSVPDSPSRGIRVNGRQFSTLNITLFELIAFTYQVHPKQLTNVPAWVEQDKFDIIAQPDGEGQPSEAQWRAMIHKLLAERFQLAFHRDKKELSVYTITVGKDGPKLAKNDSGGSLPGFSGRGPGSVGVRNSSMPQFADFLQFRVMDRPVVDRTGLEGKFDFTLVWRPDDLPAGPNAPPLPADVESRSDIYTAFQEQLGLKLEATRAPADVLVIDKVEKPSDN